MCLVALAKGKKMTKKEEATDDPYKLKSGGGISYIKDRNRERLDNEERDVTNIQESFKVEKKIRDEEKVRVAISRSISSSKK